MILIAIAIVVLAGFLIWFYAFGSLGRSAIPSTDTTSPPPSGNVTTPEEGGATDKPNKADDVQTGTPAQSNNVEPSNVSLVIVDASQYDSIFEVRSYVNSSEQGTCTYTFSRGSQKITKQTNTLANGTTTSCTTLDVNITEFSTSGDWQLVIDYLSSSKSVSGQTTKTVAIHKG